MNLQNDVVLFYLSPWPVGGSTTYTFHLYHGLKNLGYNVSIIKVGKNTENKERMFKCGIPYTRVSIRDSIRIANNIPSLLTAPAPKNKLICEDLIEKLIKAGMRTVVHDPNEFKIYDHLSKVKNPIIIRKSVYDIFPKATFIPHPYERWFTDTTMPIKNKNLFVSISRFSSIKNSRIILDTNRLLPKSKKVKFLGAENRLYTRALKDKYPEIEINSLPMEWAIGSKACERAIGMIDLTVFENDGGGTQYTFMEAMDAGSIPIIHSKWLTNPSNTSLNELKDKINCIAVSDSLQLHNAIKYISKNYIECNSILESNYKLLKNHDAKKVAKLYIEELMK